MIPALYVDFVHEDDDELPGGRAGTYDDDWIKPSWTLPQTIGWIHGRTPAWGRRFAAEYLRRKPARSLGPLSCFEAIHVLWRAASQDGDRQQKLLETLRKELYGRLASGDLTAFGKPPGASGTATIPLTTWFETDVDFLDQHGGRYDDVGTYSIAANIWSSVAYTAVRILRSDALRIWPPGCQGIVPFATPKDLTERPPFSLATRKSYPAATVDAYLKEISHQRVLTLREVEDALPSKFPRLSRQGARDARRRVFPDATKKGPSRPRGK